MISLQTDISRFTLKRKDTAVPLAKELDERGPVRIALICEEQWAARMCWTWKLFYELKEPAPCSCTEDEHYTLIFSCVHHTVSFHSNCLFPPVRCHGFSQEMFFKPTTKLY